MQNESKKRVWHVRGLSWLDAAMARITPAAGILILPLAALLCLQWPLRDWVQAYSTQANDAAQLLFGIYISAAITYAGRKGAHLTPNLMARHYSARTRSLIRKAASAFIVVPWTAFVLYASAPAVWQPMRQLESFPETFNPGYFVLKMCVWLLALLLMLQAVVDIFSVSAPADEAGAG